MTRTTNSKAAGIDLLDRLYCNQILVHLVFAQEERDWLQRLARRVREEVEVRGMTGSRSERLQHWTLCLLEILLADQLDDLAKKVPIDLPELPAGLDPTMGAAISAYRRNYVTAFVLVVANQTGAPEDEGAALDIANTLIKEFRGAPAAVRHRLVERVFAVEFPDGPLDAFAWLATMGVVPSAEFECERAVDPLPEAVAVRAASICEFEMLRQFLRGSMNVGGRRDGGFPEFLLTHEMDRISSEVRERLLMFMQAEERRKSSAALKQSFAVFLQSKWKDKDFVDSFLTRCHSMAPYARAVLEKQSTALSDIGAAMIAIRKPIRGPGKALYAVEARQPSIAHDVAEKLLKRGFERNALTLHRHYSKQLPNHVAGMRVYFSLLERSDVALPAEYEDLFHLYRVANVQ